MATLVLVAAALTAFPALAEDPSTEAPNTAPAVFECPPSSGIYPEPDPCVPTPPPPVVPEFTAPLDAWPVIPEWYCDPDTKPGVSEFGSVLRSTYDIGASTRRECEVTWGYELSYHKMGLALDWRVSVNDPYEWASGLSLIRWLLAVDSDGTEFTVARRVGVTQLIWHNRVWSVSDPNWRIYCDPRDASDKDCIANETARHDDHMHISFSLEAAYLHTSFFEALGFDPMKIPRPSEILPE